MLNKMPIDISFAKGLDTKTDPKRVPIGNFTRLENIVFQKGGLLQKRNGFGRLSDLPNPDYSYLTTLNGNLTAVGDNIASFDLSSDSWVSKGSFQQVSLSTLPLIRNSLNQSQCDAAVSPNGLVCTVYIETNGASATNKYSIADATTGQNIIAPSAIPVSSGTVSGGMRVVCLGNNFVLFFTNTIGGVSHLQYVPIPSFNPTAPLAASDVDIATSYVPASGLSWDVAVAGSYAYIAYDTTSGGQSVKIASLSTSLVLSSPAVFSTGPGNTATSVSVTPDMSIPSSPVIYVTFYNDATLKAYTASVSSTLGVITAPTQVYTSPTFHVANVTSVAWSGVCQIFFDIANVYTFGDHPATNFIQTCRFSGMANPTLTTVIRSVGLASKAFLMGGVPFFLAAFSSPYQPTYFLINGTGTSASPIIAAKLAYSNGGGYLTQGLPQVNVSGTSVSIPYLFKDSIQAVNKDTNVASGTQVAGIYAQTGIKMATISFAPSLDTAEIGQDLHLSGGFLWMYDGYLPVEHSFFLWPDTDITSPTGTALGTTTLGASMALQQYYYQFVYSWADNQGNIFRSAPSIPVTVTLSGAQNSVILNIPTLRCTMKTANPVKIEVYRWSAQQEEYYEVTSVTAPILNDTTVDSVTVTDTFSDATILGNALIYTTGGVVEDVNAPASSIMDLFDNRLWLVDAEDPNLLWYSKSVIEATPVEMSDLFTMYVAPSTAAQGSTGPITALEPMDDKLIIFKKNAIYYINGTGPDNTGANSQYSPISFITSTIGCANEKSIVFTPNGLLFQSDKGIWILGRGLDTSYIGAPVESLTQSAMVTSVVNVPGTCQVRFCLDSGVTLMYDYYYGQWSSFTGVPSVSSCLYRGLHTIINAEGQVYQETPGTYLDGSNPVLVAFQTGPIRLGDLQNYQRAYSFHLLGTYMTPHKLVVTATYDYGDGPSQTTILSPNNFTPTFGNQGGPFGQGIFGGVGSLEQFRVFLQQQRCQAFAIGLQEVYDGTFGVPAGAGLTLSGINVLCAFKGKVPTLPSALSFG